MIPCSGFIEEVQNVRTSTKGQFRPTIALRTDLSHITKEFWEIDLFGM